MLKKIYTEPLFHFLLISIGFFIAYALINRDQAPSDQIVLDDNQVNEIKANFTKRWKREPIEEEVDNALTLHQLNQGYLREARAMGFDQDDRIIDLRLRKKMDYMLESLATQTEPTEAILQSYYQQQIENYRSQPLLSFEQVYIARGSAGIEQWQQQQQQNIAKGHKPSGQSPLLPAQITAERQDLLERQFGKTFMAKIAEAPLAQWYGPFESDFGHHFVQIQQRQPGEIQPFDRVKPQVQQDWHYNNLQAFRSGFEQKLLNKYSLQLERQL